MEAGVWNTMRFDNSNKSIYMYNPTKFDIKLLKVSENTKEKALSLLCSLSPKN